MYKCKYKYKYKYSPRGAYKGVNVRLLLQIETGTPYILFKDAANRKSNQRHLGVHYNELY